jgi:hypothetical protein
VRARSAVVTNSAAAPSVMPHELPTDALAERLAARQTREQVGHRLAVNQRVGAHHRDADTQEQAAAAGLDLGHGARQRLDAAGTVARHGARRHARWYASPQRHHATDVGLVVRGADAADDHFVQFPWVDPGARQQFARDLRAEVTGVLLGKRASGACPWSSQAGGEHDRGPGRKEPFAKLAFASV